MTATAGRLKSANGMLSWSMRDGIAVERLKRDEPVMLPSNHYHDYYEIFYLKDGERRFFIGEVTYDLGKGALVLIRPNVIHRSVLLGQPSHERMLVNFRRRVLVDSFGSEGLLEVFNHPTPVYRLDPPNQYALEDRLARLQNEFRGQDDYSRTLCPMLLCELVVAIERMTERIRSRPGADALRARYQEIASYLSEHHPERITLHLLSERFGLSTFHLCRRFKENTGFSIVEYLNQVRIIEAQRLLREGRLRVADLAGRVGFENVSHFGRIFKRLIGVSPLRYRRICAGQAD